MHFLSLSRTIRTGPFKRGMVFLLALLFVSCIPDPLELKDIPAVKPEIVVASQMIPGQGVLVLLTKTFSALEVSQDVDPEEFLSQIAVNDAVVTITGPEGTDRLPFRENGLYGGLRISLQEGQTYELHVQSETLGRVSATTKVLPRVEMEAVEIDLYYQGVGDTLAAISYSFKDPPEENHYLFNMQEIESDKLIRNALKPAAYTQLFNDEEFNNQTSEFSFNFFPEGYAPGDTVAVSLSNISKEYYQFMELRTHDRLSFLDFLSEPVNYPSNVEGGKGFFNLHLPDVRLVILEQQP